MTGDWWRRQRGGREVSVDSVIDCPVCESIWYNLTSGTWNLSWQGRYNRQKSVYVFSYFCELCSTNNERRRNKSETDNLSIYFHGRKDTVSMKYGNKQDAVTEEEFAAVLTSKMKIPFKLLCHKNCKF
jgi:hypothetical protein